MGSITNSPTYKISQFSPKLLSFWAVILNAGGIDWETGLMPDDSPNRLLKEKLNEVISEAGLQQMQREPTRVQNLLDLFCCNKPSLVKACISIPGISDHSIVLADCDLRSPSIMCAVDFERGLAGAKGVWK